jgi:drug/metabolite transporter (DMT)-like permease
MRQYSFSPFARHYAPIVAGDFFSHALHSIGMVAVTSSKRLRADLALVFNAFVWGTTFVVVKEALADSSVFVYIAIRFTLSALIMAAIFYRDLRELNPKSTWAGGQIGLLMLGGYGFQTLGLQLTTPSKAGFITGCSVVLVPLLLAFFGRPINGWIWSGAAAALLGLYFLTVPTEGFTALNLGDILVFICAVMFALQIIYISRHVEKHSVGALAFLQVATTAVLSIMLIPVLSAVHIETPHVRWTRLFIFALVVTSIGSTVIGFYFQVWAQKHTSSSHAAILLTLEPVFAAVTSWLVAHEHLGSRSLFGAVLILAGILLAELKGGVPASPDPLEVPAASGQN